MLHLLTLYNVQLGICNIIPQTFQCVQNVHNLTSSVKKKKDKLRGDTDMRIRNTEKGKRHGKYKEDSSQW